MAKNSSVATKIKGSKDAKKVSSKVGKGGGGGGVKEKPKRLLYTKSSKAEINKLMFKKYKSCAKHKFLDARGKPLGTKYGRLPVDANHRRIIENYNLPKKLEDKDNTGHKIKPWVERELAAGHSWRSIAKAVSEALKNAQAKYESEVSGIGEDEVPDAPVLC